MNKSRTFVPMAALAVAAFAVGLVGCSSAEPSDQGTAGPGLKDTYVVSSDPSFVPFEFDEGGTQKGFNIDLINMLADKVGFDVDLQVLNFDGVIPGLQTGKFNIGLGLMTITPEREKTIDFSTPYFQGGYMIAVRVDNNDINSLEDLAGKRVATRLGSSSYDFLVKEAPEVTPLPFEQLDQTYMAVENGDAEAVVYDVPNVAYYVGNAGKGKLKLVGDVMNAEYNGLGLHKGQPELKAALDKALLESFQDGTYTEIYQKWFGDEPEFLDALIAQAEKSQ